MELLQRNQTTAAQVKSLEDSSKNPLTGAVWPSNHTAILETRRNLPVYEHYQELLNAYHQSQVVIMSSETGSGKSTQVPQLLVYDEYASNLQIACTQPRRLAATELAGRVAEEMGVSLGEEVGHQIRGDVKVNQNSKKTRLVYLTEGVLLNQLLSDANLSMYACVVIDEAHERTADLDMLLALLKQVISRRKDFKVVIMSTTMNAAAFQTYFNNCPLVHIKGRNFEVAIKYARHFAPDMVANTARTALHIHRNQQPGHILIFLPREQEIKAVCDLLRQHPFAVDLDVFPLSAQLSRSNQHMALQSTGTARRKCIVSTNVAETSLTIKDVVHVIDSGLSRQPAFNPRLGLHMLELRPISQASAKQRAGRAGRTRNGVCWRLYTKEDFEFMCPSTLPAIRCSNLEAIALKLVFRGYKEITDFDWLDSPHPDTVARAVQNLKDWGLLTEDCSITESGRLAARSPLDPVWYHAIEVAAKEGCSRDMIDVAALCSAQKSIFQSPSEFKPLELWNQTGFENPLSDHGTLLNAFYAYMDARAKHQDNPSFSLDGWCARRFLNAQALEEVRNLRLSIGSFVSKAAGIKPSTAYVKDMEKLRKALAIAFCTHTAMLRTGEEYRTVHENVPALLSRTSALSGGDWEWVMYTELSTSGGKRFMRHASVIDPEWLKDLPFFQEGRMLKTFHGHIRQDDVQKSLNDAKKN